MFIPCFLSAIDITDSKKEDCNRTGVVSPQQLWERAAMTWSAHGCTTMRGKQDAGHCKA